MLSLLTLNIGAAARPRSETILHWLADRDDDVIILTETSNGPGTGYLCEQFRRAGWHVAHQPDVDADRGVAVISQLVTVPTAANPFTGVSIPGRIATVTLDTEPRVTIVGVYVPSRDRSSDKTDKKQRFIGSLANELTAINIEQRYSMVVAGDYNVIARDHRPRHPGFLPFEFAMLEALGENGFVDAHDKVHPGAQVHSWIGRTGDGYRYDYFHVGKALADLITTSSYIHDTRNLGLSDHAAVSITLDVEPTRRRVSALVAADDQQSLF